VVKRTCRRTDLTMRLSGDETGRELHLWESGVLQQLPAGVGHAIVGGWHDGDDVVVVMRDLADDLLRWPGVDGRQCSLGATSCVFDPVRRGAGVGRPS
jgi:hypothetical protein